MAYHGYLPLCKQFLHQLKHPPSIMEVGVDRGVSFISLVAFLARTRQEFLACGIDILVQDAVTLTLANLDLQPKQSAYLVADNSLTVLPKMVDQGMKFDVILLDGDHNYHTVSEELKLLERMIYDHSIIVVDDYDGRWSDRDLWYSERPGYEEVSVATRKIDTEKHGVKPAVDEWLAAHPDWTTFKPVPGEPVVLIKRPSESP